MLTHAHSDHTGVAGQLHERGVPVYLHAADHELLRTGKEPWKREAQRRCRVLRHPRVWGFFVHMVAQRRAEAAADRRPDADRATATSSTCPGGRA